VNSKLKTRTKVADLKTEDGKEVTCDKDKVDMFNNFFSSVYTKEDLITMPAKLSVAVHKIWNEFEFSEKDVLQLLQKLNFNKSPGPDNVHPRILSECAEQLARPLYILFKASLSEGQVPQAWKEGKIVPIFKKGSRADVGNYRPVSLTSVCCKTMEKLVRNALLKHMIANGFLSDSQHGFVHGRSCTTQLLRVVDNLSEILD
jgi:hypothetical protein